MFICHTMVICRCWLYRTKMEERKYLLSWCYALKRNKKQKTILTTKNIWRTSYVSNGRWWLPNNGQQQKLCAVTWWPWRMRGSFHSCYKYLTRAPNWILAGGCSWWKGATLPKPPLWLREAYIHKIGSNRCRSLLLPHSGALRVPQLRTCLHRSTQTTAAAQGLLLSAVLLTHHQ